MNLNQLRYLEAAVREKNFAKAASKLYVTSQAVSKSLNELERELGVALFEKDGRGVKPTEFAIGLSRQAQGLLNDFEKLERYARNCRNTPATRGPIEVAVCTAGARGAFIPDDDFEKISSLCPELHFGIQRHQSEVCLSAFSEGLVNAAVVLGEYRARNCACTKIADISIMLLVSTGHRLAHSETISAKDLDGLTIAKPLDMRHAYSTIARRLNDCGSNPSFVDSPIGRGGYRGFLDSGGAVLVAKSSPLRKEIPESTLVPFSQGQMPLLSLCLVRNEDDVSAADFERGILACKDAIGQRLR